MATFRKRRRAEEWMDRPDVDPRALETSLGFIRRVNSFLGYTRGTLQYLEHFSRNWKRGKTVRIVDFATGSADIPRAILQWSDRRDFNIQIIGIDRHPTTVQLARSIGRSDPRLTVVMADALQAPFANDEFDYALTAMFLHHLAENDAVRVLREMDRVARRGIIAADLLRNRRAHTWISLFTMFSDPMVRHDARVSVEQAFTQHEVLELQRRANIEYAAYHRHFGHRFVLAGEKRRADLCD